MSPIYTPQDIYQSTLDLLERLTSISSQSGDLPGLDAAARCLATELDRLGLSTDIRQEPGEGGAEQPVLYARTASDGAPHLLLIGHFDTVLPATQPEHRDGRLYATGAIDMKGGLVALVGALDLLATRGVRAPKNLLLVVVPDEEVAGHLSHHIMEREGAAARGLWVLEPGQSRGDAETLVGGRRGMFDWRLEAHGRSAHAGNGYWQGRSALTAAAQWCVEIRRLAAPGPGPTINAGRMVAGESGFVDDLREAADLVGTIRQLNVVPDRALVEGEARFLRTAEVDGLRTAMAEAAAKTAAAHQVQLDFEPGPVVLPVDPQGPSQRWSQQAAQLAERAGWRLEIEKNRGGISFSNFLPDPSAIPTLDGLGPVGDGMHTREEYVELASFDRRIALLADLLAAEASS